jgi:L-amino acid N-acyltransferase YncA
MAPADWTAVARIYAAGIAAGNATFEHTVPAWEQWRAARLPEPCLVARESPVRAAASGEGSLGDGSLGEGSLGDGSSGEGAKGAEPAGRGSLGEVVGWAALSPVSSRAVYRGVGSVSIYVDPSRAGRGIGTTLLRALIDASEQAGLWTLEAGIFPENAASITLHERCGFRLIGVRQRVGQMQDGRWRDVLLYERRSEVVGCSPAN